MSGRGGNPLSKARAERRASMRETISAQRNIQTLNAVSDHISEMYNNWHAACLAALQVQEPAPGFPLAPEAIAALRLKADIAGRLLNKVLPDLRAEVAPPEVNEEGSDFVMILNGQRVDLTPQLNKPKKNGSNGNGGKQ